MKRSAVVLLCLGAPAISGCYLAAQSAGQIDILLNREPISALLEGKGRSAADSAKLRRVAEAREFGERVLGLTPSDNYTTFYETRGRPISHVVSACRQDRFESYSWWFPIVGALPYKGFFAPEDAIAEAKALQLAGYDVTLHPVAAYSTLGWFSDPVFSTMLGYDLPDLTALILHELTHGTIFAAGKADWNEAFAQFVGREGTLHFLRERGAADELKRATESFADDELIDAYNQAVAARLRRLYAGGASSGEIRLRREQLWAEACEGYRAMRPRLHSGDFDRQFRGRLNNAELVARLRYGRYDAFRKAFDAAGRDWKSFFERMRIAAGKGDPFKAME